MLVLENDQFKQREDVQIDPEDRGYQFGDGIYEVIRVYDGQPFLLGEHIERLVRSAREIKLPLPLSAEKLEGKVTELIAQAGSSSTGVTNATGNVYVQITRGVAPRTHQFPKNPQPKLIGYFIPAERPHTAMANGIKAITAPDIRWLRCDIKSLNLLGSALAKQEAVERGCQEAILHRDEVVTEGSSTNVFIVTDGMLRTHPANHLILHGITRATVRQCAEQLNLHVSEAPFTLRELLAADEVFITGTTVEISPVIEIDARPIGNGSPGPVTRRLQQAFAELIDQGVK
ncbi:D-amino-acid transaminase [Numidum massiliense]|uniref:D-amino-acid transaminase n=1 Tax=Numidum massiliense TaxID=1522315 RepID=UPI0006D58531|nr:D-amino-acid transaminase [Numidum massiliense]